MAVRFAILVACFATSHGYVFNTPLRAPACSAARTSVVMRKVDDTKRAAGAAELREAEEERLAAEEAADPEPGPCLQCGDEATYWDGMTTFACTSCGFEWGFEEAKAAAEENITREYQKGSNP